MVIAFSVTELTSLVIFIRRIQVHIDNIIAEEEKATPHQPADIETWHYQIRKAFPDLFIPPAGIPPASTYNYPSDTNAGTTLLPSQPCWMSDSEQLVFQTQIAKLLAVG